MKSREQKRAVGRDKKTQGHFVCLEPKYGEQLPAFLNDELSGEERSLVEKHLQFCSRCQEDLTLWNGVSLLFQRRWDDLNTVSRTTQRPFWAKLDFLTRFFPFNVLVRRRVPVLVPVILGLVLLPFIFLNHSEPFVDPGKDPWQVIHSDATIDFDLRKRGAAALEGEEIPRYSHGFVVAFHRPNIPDDQGPVALVIEGPAKGARKDSFRSQMDFDMEGVETTLYFTLFPNMPPGEYSASLLIGKQKQKEDECRFVVAEKGKAPEGH